MGQFKYCVDEEGTATALVDGKEITLREAVGVTALSLYEKTSKYMKEENALEKKRLEGEVIFQSRVLDSISNALIAVSRDY